MRYLVDMFRNFGAFGGAATHLLIVRSLEHLRDVVEHLKEAPSLEVILVKCHVESLLRIFDLFTDRLEVILVFEVRYIHSYLFCDRKVSAVLDDSHYLIFWRRRHFHKFIDNGLLECQSSSDDCLILLRERCTYF